MQISKSIQLVQDFYFSITNWFFLLLITGKPKNYRPKVVTQDNPDFNRPPRCLTQVHSITTNTRTGETIIVNGDYIYIQDSELLKQRKGPLPISKYLRNDKLVDVDASYTLPDGNTVFLQGERYASGLLSSRIVIFERTKLILQFWKIGVHKNTL